MAEPSAGHLFLLEVNLVVLGLQTVRAKSSRALVTPTFERPNKRLLQLRLWCLLCQIADGRGVFKVHVVDCEAADFLGLCDLQSKLLAVVIALCQKLSSFYQLAMMAKSELVL